MSVEAPHGDAGGQASPPDPDRTAGLARLAAGIAHELRNPLAVVLARVQLLQLMLRSGQPVPAAKLEQTLRAVEEQALRASKVIENLSGFARPRPPAIGPVDLPDVVAHVLALARDRMQEAAVTAEVAILPEVKALVGDRGQLITALGQLALNAIEAMPRGGRLRIRAERRAGAIEVGVADEGSGVAPDDVPRLFDPFFSTKRAAAGLGLCVAQTIAEAHGGSLRLERSEASGAEFVLSLPVAGEP
jgi:signal transduction histidine kinase